MKKLFLLCFGLLLCACNQNKKETTKNEVTPVVSIEDSEHFDWLLGNWKRLDEEQGKATFEN